MKYFEHPAVSMTRLKWFAKSPAHCKYYMENKPEPTPAMIFGGMYHCWMLEPTEFNKRYVVKLDLPLDGSEVGMIVREFEKEHEDKTLISQDDWDKCQAMEKALMANDLARSIISGGEKEKPLFANLSGVDVKTKPDIQKPEVMTLVDLKTAHDANYKEFQRAIANLKYYLQGSLYLDTAKVATGVNYDSFVFVVQEHKPPHEVAVYVLDDESVEIGRAEYSELLVRYQACVDSDSWPGYIQKPQQIGLPGWAKP